MCLMFVNVSCADLSCHPCDEVRCLHVHVFLDFTVFEDESYRSLPLVVGAYVVVWDVSYDCFCRLDCLVSGGGAMLLSTVRNLL